MTADGEPRDEERRRGGRRAKETKSGCNSCGPTHPLDSGGDFHDFVLLLLRLWCGSRCRVTRILLRPERRTTQDGKCFSVEKRIDLRPALEEIFEGSRSSSIDAQEEMRSRGKREVKVRANSQDSESIREKAVPFSRQSLPSVPLPLMLDPFVKPCLCRRCSSSTAAAPAAADYQSHTREQRHLVPHIPCWTLTSPSAYKARAHTRALPSSSSCYACSIELRLLYCRCKHGIPLPSSSLSCVRTRRLLQRNGGPGIQRRGRVRETECRHHCSSCLSAHV